jgi:hypothetical protein
MTEVLDDNTDPALSLCRRCMGYSTFHVIADVLFLSFPKQPLHLVKSFIVMCEEFQYQWEREHNRNTPAGNAPMPDADGNERVPDDAQMSQVM